MGKVKDLTPRKVSVVKTLIKEQRYSQREIAEKCDISAASVNRVKKELNLGQDFCEERTKNRKRSGVKSKFSARTRRTLIKLCKSNRRATSLDLTRQISQYGVLVSPRTVRRQLCNAGLTARRPLKKAKLTPVMMKKRMIWANQYKEWTSIDWTKVVPVSILFK